MTNTEQEVFVTKVFIKAGCNRTVNNVSWGACNLVSFGAQNAVAVFCPMTAQILTTLPGHKFNINCTHWIPSKKFAFRARHLERHYLLSGDANGIIFLWELSISEKRWKQVLQLPQLHKKSITCISGFMVSEIDAVFASASSDGTIQVWEMIIPSTSTGGIKLSSLEAIIIGTKPIVVLSLAELPQSDHHLILAVGGLDNKVHIYCGGRKGKFIHSFELKAHTDWIRGLDFSFPSSINGEVDVIRLVSSSQDKGIRIWTIALCGSLASTDKKEKVCLTSYIEGPRFIAGSLSYQISMESLLVGHEDFIYSVEWQPPLTSSIEKTAPLQHETILSASMDKTMMIWKPDQKTGIWMNVVTVGELNHSSLGFYGGQWSPDGSSILAHGHAGAFHMWKNIGVDVDNWQPQNVPSGHFAPVTDIAWASIGEYLLSVSHDQTTRIYAPWKTEASPKEKEMWHEIARPQVHGHDINSVAIIQVKGNHFFVSGADEKVARVFAAPLQFLKMLNHATLQKFIFLEDHHEAPQILGANLSALGLSQKPIYLHAAHEDSDKWQNVGIETLESLFDAVPIILAKPPAEGQLAYHTLWPESHKLYGHGNELYSLCCDHQGQLVASSCKAQSSVAAEIWLWEVGSWKPIGRLHSHNLTVTQMEFSADDSMLLTVSRDRHFSIFSIIRTGKGTTEGVSHRLIASQEAHKRIIWSCSWNPFSHEFATGSRDKTVKIWALEKDEQVTKLATLPQFESSVTAMSWVGLDRLGQHGLLAMGMENGLIELWSVTVNGRNGGLAAVLSVIAGVAVRLDPLLCHAASVTRLAWKNCFDKKELKGLRLASCGADHCVRVFDVVAK